MSATKKVSFKELLHYFPKVDLPITLGEHTHHNFSENNEPLPLALVTHFFEPLHREEMDEHTEFIPGFLLPDTFGFVAMVYWKASLMNYQHILLTTTEKGEYIDHRVIAGTAFDMDTVVQSVATITPDWEIVIVSGISGDGQMDTQQTTARQLELLPEGVIQELED